MISTFCNDINDIVNIELWINSLNGIYVKQYTDIIKLQPLKRIFMYIRKFHLTWNWNFDQKL